MSSNAFSRRSKALTIVPLALVSGLWSVSLVNVSAGASGDKPAPLPDGAKVPTQAIEAPASVPVPGVIAPGVPDGSADAVVSGASTSGIPSPALAAYQRGAQIINSADKACNIPWELIAAIGRVESNHGRYGGNVLSDKGVSTPGIYGPELNGKNNTQAISDTDGGQLDKDTVFDRAVGPMQFIPSTWSVVKVDADGDGQRNPQDIDDASLATAVYLCSGNENLATRAGQSAAVLRYNHSTSYVNLVLRIMEAYSQGDFTAEPSGSYGGTLFTPSSTTAIKDRRHEAKVRHAGGGSATGGSSSTGSSTSGSSTGGGTAPSTTPTSPANPLPGGGGGSTRNPIEQVTKIPQVITSVVSDPIGTVTNTLTQAQATTTCLAQVGVKSLAELNLLGLLKLQNYQKCMDGLGF